MGNKQSTAQKIEQIIENYTEANAISSAKIACDQKLTFDLRGSVIRNCSIAEVRQECSAMSDASLDTIVNALQSATLDSESTQVAEGLALQMNISKTDQKMLSKIVTQLRANCESNTDNVLSQVNHYDMRDMVMDCTENPDANLFPVTQYGSSMANCVVKQIVDTQQNNSSRSRNEQKNIGLKLPDLGACIGVIALIILAPALMPSGQGGSGNLQKKLKNLF